MFMKMWRTVLLTVLCSANAFSYSINYTGKESFPNPELVYRQSIGVDSSEDNGEEHNIYYKTDIKYDGIFLSQEEIAEFHRKFGYPSDAVSEEEENPTFQPWSIVWYIGSFGGLIAFFLVVSCSEWCCRNRNQRRDSQNSVCPSPSPSEAPPPAYDLFAPPSYDSLGSNGEKMDYEVFVVPVHALERLEEHPVLQREEASAPPPYFATLRSDSIPNEVVLDVARVEAEHRERPKEQREISTQT